MRILQRWWRVLVVCVWGMGRLTPTAWSQQVSDPPPTIEKIALTDEPAPGSDFKFAGFHEPIINAKGDIAFRSGSDAFFSQGVWISNTGVLRSLVIRGDEATGIMSPPGAPPDSVVTLGSFATIGINSVGTMFFESSGLWTATSRAGRNLVADFGVAPFGGAFSLPFSSPTISGPSMDGAGNVVFIEGLAGVNVPAIFKGRSPDTVDIIASGGQPAPDISGDVNIQAFTNFVVNPNGDVAFAATLDGDDARTGSAFSTFNDVAIFVTRNGGLRLVVRQGDDTPGGAGGGTFETVSGVVDVSQDLGTPLINNTGEVLFSAFTPKDANDLTNASLWKGTGPNDLRLIVNTGDVTSTAKGDVTFFGFDLAVMNTAGEVVFRGTDTDFNQAIWKWTPSGASGTLDTIVEAGDAAPDSDAQFAGFYNLALNSAGHVAFEADLSLDGTGVTLDNDKGIWAQDPDGQLRLIAREGELLIAFGLGARNVEGFSFVGKSGNADGRPSGFSDNGDLAFLATFPGGLPGVFRATFQGVTQPQGTEFIWSGACRNTDWHATCPDTNWNDTDGLPVDAPPGDGDDEVVTIGNATVNINEKSVGVEALASFGSLAVNENLTLAKDSSIEALMLSADLTSNGTLTLSGESTWQSGTINTGSTGTVVNSGVLTIADNPESRKLSGTNALENTGTVKQLGDLDLSNGRIDNKGAGTWTLIKGDLTVDRGDGTFTNRSELVKPADSETADSTIQAFVEIEDSILEVNKKKLTFNRGIEFKGAIAIIVDAAKSEPAELVLSAVGGAGIYRVVKDGDINVLSQTNPAAPLKRGVVRLTDRATLNVLDNATWIMGKRTTLVLDGGTISGPGEVRIEREGLLDWKSGTIGLPSIGATSANVVIESGNMVIEAGSAKTLAGTLTLKRGGTAPALGIPATVSQEQADLTINGGTIQIDDGGWTVTDTATIAATFGGKLNIGKKGRFTANTESGTVTISAPLENLGIVRVDSGTLRLTGRINQVSGNTLTKGTWWAESRLAMGDKPISNLEMPNHVIRTIGADAQVILSGVGHFSSLKLERNAGGFTLIFGAVYETPGDFANLTSQSRIDVFLGSKLKVIGRLTNEGRISVANDSSIETVSFQTDSLSQTRINGMLSGRGAGAASFIVNGGDFFGSGTINGQRFDNNGRLWPGASPGAMTINADYTQSTEGSLEIEIGGTTSEVEHDQLIVNGNVELAGTLVLKFIDDFSPRTGQTFDFLAVDGSRTGAFDNVEVVDLAPGFEFQVAATDAGMMMTALSDGVYTGIIGEIADVTLGPEPPPDASTAALGDTGVPMLQFDVSAEADGLSITEITFSAGGSGNDAEDVQSVTVWLDGNGDGQADEGDGGGSLDSDLPVDGTDDVRVTEGDRVIGSGSYDTDDGLLTLSIDPPLEVGARETVTLLVTYGFAGVAQQAQPDSGAKRTRATLHSLGIGLIILPSLFLLGMASFRKRRAGGLACVLTAGALWFSGCGGGTGRNQGSGSGSDGGPKTFQVTLTAIEAQEAGSGTVASVGGLSLKGTTVTIKPTK